MNGDALSASASWLATLLTGTTALLVATLCVAIHGMAMLGGSVSIRRSAEIIIGLAIVFGANTIVSAFQQTAPFQGSELDRDPLQVSALSPRTENERSVQPKTVCWTCRNQF